MTNITVNDAVHLFPAVHMSKAVKLAAQRKGLSTPAFYQYVSLIPLEYANEKTVLHVFSKCLVKAVALSGDDILLAEKIIKNEKYKRQIK
jgi:hypothetical protein